MDYNVSEILQAMAELQSKTKVAKPKITMEVEDWSELQKGDVVRSIQGYGPYFENSLGEKTFQGSYGYFRVDEVSESGLHVYEYSPRGMKLSMGGRRFIYMGPSEKVDVIHRQPHKLLKVNK